MYWTGTLPARITPSGTPCAVKFLDVKATEDKIPLLFKWLPATPSPKSKARIEIHQATGVTGLLPFSIPEVFPNKVAALVVDESTGLIKRGAILNAAIVPGLSAFSVYQGDVGGVDLNVSGNYDVVIVSSRDAGFTAPASGTALSAVCTADPVQTICYGKPWSSLSNRIYSIYAYSGATAGGDANPPNPPPALKQVELTGGNPTDLSQPYFNVDAGYSIGVSANIAFGNGGADPRPYPICAQAWPMAH